MEDASLIRKILMVLEISLARVTMVTMEFFANLTLMNVFLRRAPMVHVKIRNPVFPVLVILDILVRCVTLISTNVYQVHVFSGFLAMTGSMGINVGHVRKVILVMVKYVTETTEVSKRTYMMPTRCNIFHQSSAA